jgi:hypothetical protein
MPVELSVAVPNRVEVNPDLALGAIGHDDPAAPPGMRRATNAFIRRRSDW